ncbi:F0F1 ATP synthase subunit C [Oceanithermus sp.]
MIKRFVALLGMLVLGALAFAAEGNGAGGSSNGLVAVGVGLAIGLSALGTGWAQSRIGAAAVGATAEKPSMFGTGLIFLLLPETLVIFGFLLAYLLLGKV